MQARVYRLSQLTQSIAVKDKVNIITQIMQPYLQNLKNVVEDFVRECELFDTVEEKVLFIENTQNYLSQFMDKPLRVLIDDL